MSRATHENISSGLFGWDADVNTDFDLIFTNPCPLADFANKGALPAAASNDDSIAVTVDDHRIYISDTVDWIQVNPKQALIVAVGDEVTAITTGTAKVTFRMPYRMKLTEIRGSLTTAGSGATIVDVNEGGTTLMTTNKLNFDASETTSLDATTQPGITDADLADDAVITVDIDTAGASAAGLKVMLIGDVLL